MNKTIALGIMALLLASSALATSPELHAKHLASLHWMSPASEPCQVPVNAFSTRMVSGFIGHRSDGSTICYVPRHRSSCVPEGSPAALRGARVCPK